MFGQETVRMATLSGQPGLCSGACGFQILLKYCVFEAYQEHSQRGLQGIVIVFICIMFMAVSLVLHSSLTDCSIMLKICDGGQSLC